jgi:hypothetical protein
VEVGLEKQEIVRAEEAVEAGPGKQEVVRAEKGVGKDLRAGEDCDQSQMAKRTPGKSRWHVVVQKVDRY